MTKLPAHESDGLERYIRLVESGVTPDTLNHFMDTIRAQLPQMNEMFGQPAHLTPKSSRQYLTPENKSVIKDMFALIKDTLQTMEVKDYYLALRIVIHAEMRKPEDKQDSVLLIALCSNAQVLDEGIATIIKAYLAKHVAVMQRAIDINRADKGMVPGEREKAKKGSAIKDPEVRMRAGAYRKEHGI